MNEAQLGEENGRLSPKIADIHRRTADKIAHTSHQLFGALRIVAVNGYFTENTLTLQTPTERLTIPLDEVEDSRDTNLSLMPEGQLDVLTDDGIRDLIAYLMSPEQIPKGE
jgi:hypothetical protein